MPAILSDKVSAIGVLAPKPSSGTVVLQANQLEHPHFKLKFVFDKARMPVTDAGASGAFGSLALFTFNQQAISFLGTRADYTSFVEGAALTGGAGNATFKLGVGATPISAATDNSLATGNKNVGNEVAVTLSGGNGAGTSVTGAGLVLDGTATPVALSLNFSGSAASIAASSTIDITGSITVTGIFLDDD